MKFIPDFPLHVNLQILLSSVLVLGLISEKITKFNRFIPPIFGYIVIGFLIGPNVLNIVDHSLVSEARVLIEISLGLILFKLGRYLDLTWLKYDYNLLLISLTEAGLTFSLAFIALLFSSLPWLIAAWVAMLAIITSPAIIMSVAYDLSAQGPITRRVFILTSLNTLLGLILFSLFLPLTQMHVPISLLFLHTGYHLIGSLSLGLVMFLLTDAVAWIIGKNEANQFFLCISMVVLAVVLACILKLSVMLTAFIFGVACKNLDKKHLIMEFDFRYASRIFLIFLFVMMGTYIDFKSLFQIKILLAVLLFIFARGVAKTIGVFLLSKNSCLTKKQAFLIGISLLPMFDVALTMLNTLNETNTELGQTLSAIMIAIVSILALIAPISTDVCFVKAGETDTQ